MCFQAVFVTYHLLWFMGKLRLTLDQVIQQVFKMNHHRKASQQGGNKRGAGQQAHGALWHVFMYRNGTEGAGSLR